MSERDDGYDFGYQLPSREEVDSRLLSALLLARADGNLLTREEAAADPEVQRMVVEEFADVMIVALARGEKLGYADEDWREKYADLLPVEPSEEGGG